jgi:2-polyprenyl-3-methyl-5-hydroxy-6-metoxy-1,4-benzoquinol methylase
LFLSRRNPDLAETMDSPNCDPALLTNTYRQFRLVNTLLSRAKAVYRRWIRPAMADRNMNYSLLDIGFGGGDIAMNMTRWAQRDGYRLDVTGIEIDRRAYEYVKSLEWPKNASFHYQDVAGLVERGETFDFVVSNHLLHHLDADALPVMLDQARRLARRRAVFIDIRRSDLAYALFSMLTLMGFRHSYIRSDGLTSIRRSYTRPELAAIAPPEWEVRTLAGFRLVLVH